MDLPQVLGLFHRGVCLRNKYIRCYVIPPVSTGVGTAVLFSRGSGIRDMGVTVFREEHADTRRWWFLCLREGVAADAEYHTLVLYFRHFLPGCIDCVYVLACVFCHFLFPEAEARSSAL